ncbi:unnamed protein product [Caenorhabditis auriculariae]|uniref:Uncharacterized protein n=1 Tax=Caenorhabditis auriculariae TaxID=2777116 RepID=A0A8S1HB85_9PELO|nr:unnamed protein product [Caenorhabditis auriculariae]
MTFHFHLLAWLFHFGFANKADPYYCYGDGVLHKGSPCRFFSVVIDAGSTGSRLHLYRYVHNSNPNGLPFLVEEEVFQEVKPGLSSFAGNPSAASKSIEPLLLRARKEVPHFMWEKTPVTLKATAGLRLLPGDLADEILEDVEKTIFSSGFFATAPDAVSVMSGSDEGVYSWFTLNLLLDTLYSKNPTSPHKPTASLSAAALDLGGGSTQITFWPEDVAVFEEFPGYERDIDFFGAHIRLFTHSFLGNGLVAARLNVLLWSTNEALKKQQQLMSPCMPADFQIADWEYALKFWSVNGTRDYSHLECYEAVRDFVRSSKIMPIKQLSGKQIYLFSYFFDRALNSGLVKSNAGGKITLRDFRAAAEKACSRTSEELNDGSHWMPWQCLDLSYIYSLLHDGYMFSEEQPLVLAKKIKGMEVSWGQGLSYALINEFNEYERATFGSEEDKDNSTVVDQIMGYIYSGTNHVLLAVMNPKDS